MVAMPFRLASLRELVLFRLRTFYREPGILFSGYLRDGGLLPRPSEAGGWFPTGDVGSTTPDGELVFLERMADSLRIGGEFVPLEHVEGRLRPLFPGAEISLGARPSGGAIDELVLYVAGPLPPAPGVLDACAGLPRAMRPRAILRIAAIPRDDAVLKVRRRELPTQPVLEVVRLDERSGPAG